MTNETFYFVKNVEVPPRSPFPSDYRVVFNALFDSFGINYRIGPIVTNDLAVIPPFPHRAMEMFGWYCLDKIKARKFDGGRTLSLEDALMAESKKFRPVGKTTVA